MIVEIQIKEGRGTRITLGTETEAMVYLCSMSDNNVTDKIDGIQTEDNRVKGTAAFIDVARGACGRIGVASLIPLRRASTRATIHLQEVKIVNYVRRLRNVSHHP